MTIQFNLHNPSKKETLIYVKVRHARKVIANWSTSQKIPPNYWNGNRIKKTYPGYMGLNALLDRIESDFKDYIRACFAQGVPVEKKGLRDILDEVLQRPSSDGLPRTFFDFFDYFIEEREKSPKYSYYTTRSYHKVRRKIREFNPRLDWPDLGLSFFFRWTDYLFDQDLQTNYVSKLVKTLKVILRDARDRGYPVNPEFEHKQFKVKEKKIDKTYLTEDEISAIINVDLGGNEYLEKIRDLMLVACFTGARFSDFTRINSDIVESTTAGRTVIRLKTVKSGRNTEVVVPLHPLVRLVLEKRNGKLPSLGKSTAVANVLFNRYLKEVCELAGINEPTISTSHEGGQTTEVLRPKFELVTAHTFRRTFITHNRAAGVPDSVIMAATGITKVDTLAGYDRLEKERSAEIIERSSYFNSSRWLRRIK